MEEKKKHIILNFTLQCPSSSPSSIWLSFHKLHPTWLFFFITFFKRCSKFGTRIKKPLSESLVGQLRSDQVSRLREKLRFTDLNQAFPYGWLTKLTSSKQENYNLQGGWTQFLWVEISPLNPLLNNNSLQKLNKGPYNSTLVLS